MSKGKRQAKRAPKNKVNEEQAIESALNVGVKEAADMESLAYAVRGADIAEPIPLGVVPDLEVLPKTMRAWVIRKERHGEPMKSFQEEVMPVPDIGPNEVLVLVMAAGVNYNGIWAGRGEPISVLDVHKESYHIAGSDASGIVWKVGSNVKSWKPGDEVILHCNIESETHTTRTETPYDFISYDPMASRGQRIWGYETPCFQNLSILLGKRLPPMDFVILLLIGC